MLALAVVVAFLLIVASSLYWLLDFCAVACDIHAGRLLAKAGGSKRKLRGIPTLGTRATAEVERAKRSGGLHKRSGEDWGRGLRARGGWSPSLVREGRCREGKAPQRFHSRCLYKLSVMPVISRILTTIELSEKPASMSGCRLF
jgi:hypothetical protein